MDWEKESEMFDQTSEYYDTFGTSYPMDIVDKIIDVTKISSHTKLTFFTALNMVCNMMLILKIPKCFLY
ncbi:hypothetical protein OXPF_06540 [Oxobacter pfennigii]|uniref:Uncharacterized protein n=1 Tax=Oxobacter pfennigii TaxID=36849 RepID=A0A0P8WCG4_9CLOT|nr:hypothetical protein OXPF_06540 [Oxobacter pfennigii]